MKVTFLGTGTSQGIPVIGCDCEVCTSNDQKDKRLRTSVLVEVQGKKIVIDTGPDFRQQMLRAGTQELHAVLFTHEHKDHIAGLDDVRAFNFKYNRDMPLYASERVQQRLKQEYSYAFAENPYPGSPMLKLNTVANEVFSVEGVEVTPIQVLHGKLPVHGFRMADFTYITDAKTIEPSEKEKIKGSKVLVLNALRRKEHHSHLTLSQALDLAAELQPEQAFFTHFSHLLGKHAEVSRELPDNVYLAYDGLTLEW